MSIVAFFAAGLQLVLAIILAIIAIYIGLSVFGKLTKGIDEIEELKRGNVAIGIIFAALVQV
ncbi:MAG: DUF350 domain-containing protein [Euryarchaeota archaeon]|nr:DUF350 domain-containing protein [Euryarchaeota archaeon]